MQTVDHSGGPPPPPPPGPPGAISSRTGSSDTPTGSNSTRHYIAGYQTSSRNPSSNAAMNRNSTGSISTQLFNPHYPTAYTIPEEPYYQRAYQSQNHSNHHQQAQVPTHQLPPQHHQLQQPQLHSQPAPPTQQIPHHHHHHHHHHQQYGQYNQLQPPQSLQPQQHHKQQPQQPQQPVVSLQSPQQPSQSLPQSQPPPPSYSYRTSQPYGYSYSPLGTGGPPTGHHHRHTSSHSSTQMSPSPTYDPMSPTTASASAAAYRYSPMGSPSTPRIQTNPWMSPASAAGNVMTGSRSPTRGNISPARGSPLSRNSSIHQPAPHNNSGNSPHNGNSNNNVAPVFRRLRSKSELTPVSHSQPRYRRAVPEGGFMSPLNALTTQLSSTYHLCNPAFNYQSSKNPRRVLTKPSEGKLNNGFDNSESDYILYVNDVLGVEDQRRYLVLDILGQGTFGQVVKCQNMVTKEIVAVKVIKNKPAYLNQSMMEVSILEHLNNKVDKNDQHHLLRLKDKFVHKEHLCLVFELLSSNLYELIKQNGFRGLSTNLVRVFSQQLLDSLTVLKESRLIHCDLKPENILLKSLDSPVIKVIDFGSACHERHTVYTYIQSRFYRSPEVILGLPYTTSIDMWSLGCIVAELFLGLPIFPGTSEYNQLSRIIDMLGNPPNWMIEMGKNSGQFMEKYVDERGSKQYRLKSIETYSREFNTEEQKSKQYFPSNVLKDIIMGYPLPRKNMSKEEVDAEMQNRIAFSDFVHGLLNLNPFERWTPQQASSHPFVTGAKFIGPYVPSLDTQRKMQTGTATATPHAAQPLQVAPQPQVQAQPVHQVPPVAVPAPVVTQQPQSQQPFPGKLPPSASASYYNNNMRNGNVYYGGGAAAGSTSANTATTRRARATTFGQLDAIPGPIQRAAALMNPAQPIRAQPSPAYIPPPELYGYGRRPSQHNNSGDIVRNLENGLSYT